MSALTLDEKGVIAVCPNCGYAENDLESLPDLYGDPTRSPLRATVKDGPRSRDIVCALLQLGFSAHQQAGRIQLCGAVGAVQGRPGLAAVDGRGLLDNGIHYCLGRSAGHFEHRSGRGILARPSGPLAGSLGCCLRHRVPVTGVIWNRVRDLPVP